MAQLRSPRLPEGSMMQVDPLPRPYQYHPPLAASQQPFVRRIVDGFNFCLSPKSLPNNTTAKQSMDEELWMPLSILSKLPTLDSLHISEMMLPYITRILYEYARDTIEVDVALQLIRPKWALRSSVFISNVDSKANTKQVIALLDGIRFAKPQPGNPFDLRNITVTQKSPTAWTVGFKSPSAGAYAAMAMKTKCINGAMILPMACVHIDPPQAFYAHAGVVVMEIDLLQYGDPVVPNDQVEFYSENSEHLSLLFNVSFSQQSTPAYVYDQYFYEPEPASYGSSESVQSSASDTSFVQDRHATAGKGGFGAENQVATVPEPLLNEDVTQGVHGNSRNQQDTAAVNERIIEEKDSHVVDAVQESSELLKDSESISTGESSECFKPGEIVEHSPQQVEITAIFHETDNGNANDPGDGQRKEGVARFGFATMSEVESVEKANPWDATAADDDCWFDEPKEDTSDPQANLEGFPALSSEVLITDSEDRAASQSETSNPHVEVAFQRFPFHKEGNTNPMAPGEVCAIAVPKQTTQTPQVAQNRSPINGQRGRTGQGGYRNHGGETYSRGSRTFPFEHQHDDHAVNCSSMRKTGRSSRRRRVREPRNGTAEGSAESQSTNGGSQSGSHPSAEGIAGNGCMSTDHNLENAQEWHVIVHQKPFRRRHNRRVASSEGK